MNEVLINNFIWKLLERIGFQAVSIIVSIILSRQVNPADHGTITLVTAIITILNVFIDCGFGNALIQKKDADNLDFSTVFYFNIFSCSIIYSILYVLSPIVVSVYKNYELTPIIRVLGLTIIISGIKSIQNNYVAKYMLFKKYFFVTLFGKVISAIISVWMAYNGYGVWALAAQSLANNIIDTIVLWFTIAWRPSLEFSFSRLKELFDYGWKLLASTLLDTIWRKLTEIIIGLKFTSNDLAFYNKGNNLPEITTFSVLSSIDSVLFPTMSKEQDNITTIKDMTRKAIRVGSYMLWPMMAGLAICSDNLIVLVLTDKWLPAVPYLRIFCITYAFYPIHTSNLNSIKALGRSDIFLKLEIIKKVVGLVIILISMRYGVYAMALSTIVSSVLSQIINSYPNKNLLNYRYIDQLKDLFPSLAMSVIMGIVVYCINFIGLNNLLTLVIQVISGMIIYLVLSIITKNESLNYCLNILKSIVDRKKSKTID